MAIFIDTMSKALQDLDDCVLSYVDDVIVFSETIGEHYANSVE